jgi:hypothetical protein
MYQVTDPTSVSSLQSSLYYNKYNRAARWQRRLFTGMKALRRLRLRLASAGGNKKGYGISIPLKNAAITKSAIL